MCGSMHTHELALQTRKFMKKMGKARGLAIRQVGKANVKLIEKAINELFDDVFYEIKRKNPDKSFDDYVLWRAPKLLVLDKSSEVRNGKKNIFRAIHTYLIYRCSDDKNLLHCILNRDRYVMRYIKYVLRDALLTLGKRLAEYFECKLGFPKGSLVFRYDFTVRGNNNVFDKYVFALYARRDLRDGDSIGDWIVLSNEGFNLMLRNKNTGIEWEFTGGIDFMYKPYLEYRLMFYENHEHFCLFTNGDYFVYESKTKPWTLCGIVEAVEHIQLLNSFN